MFNFVLPIQHSLRHYGMDLSRLYFLPSEEYIWAIANLNSDPISQLATTYSATEVAIFKKIVPLPQRHILTVLFLVEKIVRREWLRSIPVRSCIQNTGLRSSIFGFKNRKFATKFFKRFLAF